MTAPITAVPLRLGKGPDGPVPAAWTGSLLGHLALVAGAVLVGKFAWPVTPPVPAAAAPIEAVLVDPRSLRSAVPAPAPVPEVVATPVPDPAIAAREREAAEVRQREQAKAEAAARAKAELREKADAKAQADAKAKADAKAQADAKARADAKAKADAATREREAAEAALARQLAAEDARAAAVKSGLLEEWYARLQQRVEASWFRPPTARRGLKCRVTVTMVPGGTVVGATVGECNGDATVRESLRNAVLRASPLPMPRDPALFERTLVLEFTPDD